MHVLAKKDGDRHHGTEQIERNRQKRFIQYAYALEHLVQADQAGHGPEDRKDDGLGGKIERHIQCCQEYTGDHTGFQLASSPFPFAPEEGSSLTAPYLRTRAE